MRRESLILFPSSSTSFLDVVFSVSKCLQAQRYEYGKDSLLCCYYLQQDIKILILCTDYEIKCL